MTLRGMLGGDVQHIQEQIADLLDREDGLIVLFDGSRMVSYSQGFGVSPCQLELLNVEIERIIRNVIGGQSLMFGLVMLPTTILAGLLVVYFDWRAKLHRRVLAERDTYRKAA